MNDDLQARLRASDPMAPDATIHVPVESPTSPTGRRRLEAIMSTPTTEQSTETTGPQRTAARERSRTPWFAAIAAVAVAVVAVGAIAIGSGGDDAVVAGNPMELTAGPSDIMASCLAPSADVLRGVEVAFAGTVTTIEGEIVTLEVTQWYVGGDAPSVVVTAPAGLEALTGSVPFAVGDDFLVSATGGIVNYCGLSGSATPEMQAMYDAAFGG
jgi:hypothetical protein